MDIIEYIRYLFRQLAYSILHIYEYFSGSDPTPNPSDFLQEINRVFDEQPYGLGFTKPDNCISVKPIELQPIEIEVIKEENERGEKKGPEEIKEMKEIPDIENQLAQLAQLDYYIENDMVIVVDF